MSKDIVWDYGRLVKPNNYIKVQCRKCKKILYRGINRHKQHIASVGGEVVKCFSTINERHLYGENLEAAKMKKVNKKQADYEARKEDQISEEREAKNLKLSLVSSKKPRVRGTLDRMVNVGKLKQTVMNEAELKKWKWLTKS